MKIQRLLSIVTTGLLMAQLPIFSAKAGTDIDFNELKNGKGPVVFLVNGFGGCDPCILKGIHNDGDLQSLKIPIYDLDWNDIHRRSQAKNPNLGDDEFLQQMDSVLGSINPERPIILIGHSFGGDSVLKVAQRVAPRKIAFLGVLDGVELGGLRTRRSVGSNVSYFYNRWTRHPTFNIPLNANASGQLICQAPTICEQKEQSFGYDSNGKEIRDDCGSFDVKCDGYNYKPRRLGGSNGTRHRQITHGGANAIYRDDFIEKQIVDIIKKQSQANTPGSSIRSAISRAAKVTSESLMKEREERIKQLYIQVLGREADPGGLSHGVNLWMSNQLTFEQLRASMASGQESRGNINKLYREYLNRDADPGGMEHHVNLLGSGQMTLDQIREGIKNGEEAKNLAK